MFQKYNYVDFELVKTAQSLMRSGWCTVLNTRVYPTSIYIFSFFLQCIQYFERILFSKRIFISRSKM